MLINGLHGKNIPQLFARDVDRTCCEGVMGEDWDILDAGPESEEYWEAWTDVVDNAVLTCPNTGDRYKLTEDYNLFLLPMEEELEIL